MGKTIDELISSGINDYTFNQYPEPKTISDYEKAQEEFIDYYKKIKGVVSIYKFGNLGAPGFSDLDFVVILDDKYKHRYGTQYNLKIFSRNTQYILLHNKSFLSESLVKYIDALHYHQKLEKVWGGDVEFLNYNKTKAEQFHIMHKVEDIIVKFPRMILQPLLEGRISIRGHVNKLNAVSHFNEIVCKVTNVRNKEVDDRLNKIKMFRKSWFERPLKYNLEQLPQYTKDAIEIGAYLIERLAQYLESNIYNEFFYSISPDEKIGFRRKDTAIYFKHAWSPVLSLNKTINTFLKTKEYIGFFPLCYGFLLLGYAKCNGKFANFINKQLFLKPKLNVDGEYLPIIEKARCLEKYFEFLTEKRIVDGTSFCQLGYEPDIKRSPCERTYIRGLQFISKVTNKIPRTIKNTGK